MRLTFLTLFFLFLFYSTAVKSYGEGSSPSSLALNSKTLEEISKEKLHHTKSGRFHNPWRGATKYGFFSFLKWRFSSKPYKEEKKSEAAFPVTSPDFEALERAGGDYAVWLGHSTVLIKTAGKRILTDPIFWDINFIKTIKRKTPFPLDPEKLPPIDFVLISHGHYDHLDKPSLKFLNKHSAPTVITCPGYKKFLKKLGIKNHIETDWWEELSVEGVSFRAIPVSHWSKRTPLDTNKMLWCGFTVEGSKKYVWIGDTGYFPGFSEVGKKLGPFNVAFVPIGSYEPRWFMELNHVNPNEALKVAEELGAKTFIPIHWGTFDLTDETLHMPVDELKKIIAKQPPGSLPHIPILTHGGHIIP